MLNHQTQTSGQVVSLRSLMAELDRTVPSSGRTDDPLPVGHTFPSAKPAKKRLGWLDASRTFAALGVVMIHSSADPAGNAFNTYPVGERVIPALFRTVGEMSGSELFLIFSLFMLAMKVAKPNPLGLVATLQGQAQRLLIPFAAWSVFYLAFRFVKASAFGYSQGLLIEETDWHNWPGYLLMGSAQYHLHFLPTLFAIMLFYPVMKSAIRFPLIGLVLIPLLYFMDTVQNSIWALVADPTIRDLLIRAVKIVCYSGYGFAAFSLFGIWQRGMSDQDNKLFQRFALCMVAITFMTTLAYTGAVIKTGMWVTRPGAAFYAHFLMPTLVFTAFMAAQNISWSPIFGRLAKVNFGVYLIHPVFVDLYDVGTAKAGLHLNPGTMVATKWITVVICAYLTAFLFSKLRPVAWTIGLGGKKASFQHPRLQPQLS